MTAGPDRLVEGELDDALWCLLAASDDDDPTRFTAEHDRVEPVLVAATEPLWTAWRHAFAARRSLLEGDREAAAAGVRAARDALIRCPPDARTALTLAYLAHVEVASDHFDAAMLTAIDASLIAESPGVGGPSRELHQAHQWLSLTLTALDLEELAVAQALSGHRVAAALPDLADQWRLLQLCAQQHAELAQTLHRRGDTDRSRELADVAVECAQTARALDWEPDPAEQSLLDVVQAWGLACRGDLDDALGPLRSAHRRVHRDGGIWLRGYTDLVLARLLTRLSQSQAGGGHGAEATDLLVDAAGAFAATGDRRRYRQCLLELGQSTAAMGRPAEALHWLEAYRADTGRAHARGRELWAEMFVRRSRLREAERQTAVLRRHAMEDPLTGLGNRRSAERRLSSLRLGDEPLSLAVVDVDRFKEVNDDTSHTHGDEVLRRVAGLLLEHSRTGDEVYRWAGDEFLVVLPTATESQALVAMDRLRAAVAAADWGDLQLAEPVTVSIGVATEAGAGEGPFGWRSLFDTADLHLFTAKRSGRNRVRAPGGRAPCEGAP
ncbi:GGDEF domain-containing protein [Geodermatophilus sabuli]|uniref:Diguanylate cyclase (GGDEF) domain-containing protein n=1 Tax=Geodermatophilus sabuli TaxID=1564158 RepID=A0A285EKZ6_9ACTN|nr:GGDEF domain-containing protein [Geodermatophilus sabuli]MBB3086782.1 diguanylate cyclase (GGDEF)-like protein [Geodermatophilus sabuli]SNX98844.1 diguanylate cyclase (GGDEF) domain-containing protein [Geodermatophilus sabuli]